MFCQNASQTHPRKLFKGDIRLSCTHAFPWLFTFSNRLWLWSSSLQSSYAIYFSAPCRADAAHGRMPGSRPKRKRREVQEEEGSSDAPLTKAAKSCRDGGDEAAADGRDLAFDVDADVDGAAAQKRNWRRTRRVRATHEAWVARGALQTIQTCLGRVPPKSAESWRKRRKRKLTSLIKKRKLRAGSFTTRLLIEMASFRDGAR